MVDVKKSENGLSGDKPGLAHEEASPAWVEGLAAALDKEVCQLFIVACDGIKKVTGTASMHERGKDGKN